MRLTLRFQVLAFSSCVILLVGGTISLHSIVLGRQRIAADFERKAGEITALIAKAVINKAYFLDVGSLNHTLQEALINPDITHAAVLDAEGQLLAETERPEGQHPEPDPHPSHDDWRHTDDWISWSEGSHLHVGGPLLLADGTRVGSLAVGFSLEDKYRQLRETTNAHLLVTLLSLGIGTLLGAFSAGYLTRPIAAITKAAREIGEGKLDTRLRLRRRDELGLLAEAVNRMAADLRTTTVSRAHLDNILSSMADPLIVLEPDGTIRSVNRATLDLLKYEQDELARRPARMLFGSKGFGREGVVDLLRNGLVRSVESSCVTKDGREIPVAVSGAVMQDDDGRFEGIVCVAKDITERKKAEQMKSDFVSFVTHQLRTPLSGIRWMLELAEQARDLPEETRSYIADAQGANERLIRLVNDLLDVSRLEQGKLTIVPEEIHLGKLTRSVLDDLAPLIAEKGHRLSVTGTEEVPPLWVDPQLLRQVILNLASNALKYTLPGGGIAIQMRHEDAAIRWAITDSGIGIPAQGQRHLFEKFYRAGNVLSIETEGTGLGLYLVRLIIEQLGGRIWCESEEGKGSMFTFTLPLRGGPAQNEQ